MDLKPVLFGFVFITIIFIVFNIAFDVPIKTYIPQEDLDQLESLGMQYVGEAKPSFFSQIYFFISSFWTILKTTFRLLTVGMTSMIFDVGGMFSIPYVILSLLAGILVYLLAIVILDKLRGGK